MTITRLLTAGLESNGASSLSEFNILGDTNQTSVSNASVKTGSYALRLTGNYNVYVGHLLSTASRQVRSGFWLNGIAGMWSGETGYIFTIWSAAARLFDIRITGSDNRFMFYIGGSLNAYSSALMPISGFRHFGIDAKIHPSAGWIKVYLDGVEIFTFSGNTGNVDITKVIWGNDANSHYSTTIYIDDIYLDDTTNEAAPVRLLGRQFLAINANGNGASSGMTGSDDNQTDNYALVDEIPHNSDTDYVKATAAGQKDTYAMTTVTPPAGMTFAAVIPFIVARKLNVEDIQIKTVLRSGSTELIGVAQQLSTAYATYNGLRVELNPNTGLAWTQTGIDALEAGAQAAGTFTA